MAFSMAAVMALMTGCAGNQEKAEMPAASKTSELQGTEKQETENTKGTETAREQEITAQQADENAGERRKNCVTDDKGWVLWDETGKLTLDGRGAGGRTAVVSSGKYEASQAGLEVLKAGGNAVDAAVAVSFALGVAEPNASGIGGGGFMTIHSADGENVFINFRENAPSAASPAMWEVDENGKVAGNQKAAGGKSVGVPGNVKGMEYAFENYGSGKVAWKDVLAPAVTLAEEGFIVTPSLFTDMLNSYDSMLTYPELGKVYLNPDGLNYQTGDTFTNPDLAETLRVISENGSDGFYTGAVAQKIVDAVNQHDGVFTLEDLSSYEVKVMEPVQGTYRGYQIISSPLPSSGGTHVIEALNIMENFDIAAMGFDSPERLHVLTEAFRMCFRDREEFMGDPDYVDVPVNGILSKERAGELAARIIPGKAAVYEPVSPWQYEHEDTTHFSVADAEGNMVSVTQTVNGIFGSKVIPDGCGFVLNNEMNDFSADPESPNAIAGGKVPLSSMSPTIVLKEDGTPFMVLGSPGATKIITTTVQVISNVIDFKMDIQEAVNAPRIYNQASETVEYEARFGESTIEALKKSGNEPAPSDAFNKSFGAVNAVMYGEDGTLSGGADPRRDGKAVGY